MLADHFTKAVQGSQFRKLRSKIQGIPEDSNDALMGWDRPSLKTKVVGIPSPQECVGTNAIRAYDTTSAPGSKGVATPSAEVDTVTADAGADASADVSADASARAKGGIRCANAASYASAARRALKLPARMSPMMT
jgi:hypothetical protein